MRLLGMLLCAAMLAVWAGPGASQPVSPPPPQRPEGYEAYWKRGEYREALRIIEETLGPIRDFVPAAALADYAQLLFENGRVDAAIGAMEKAINRSADLLLIVRLAELYQFRGRMDDFQEALRQARMAAGGRGRTAYKEMMLGMAKLAELEGQNPKQILSSYLKVLTENVPHFAGGHIAAGDLAYRKYGYDIAAKHYQRALEVDAENQSALAGLAECYWKSGDPRLEAAMKQLAAYNPHHPRARGIEAEKLLDLNKTSDALTVIDGVLAINPVHPRFLGLRAAALFLQERVEEAEETLRRVAEFNPHCSEPFRILARIASRHYRFEEAIGFSRRALAADPQDHEARAQLAFDLLRTGGEAEGRRELEMAFSGDPFHVHAYNMLNVLDSIETFETIDAGAFTIELPAQEARVMGAAMRALLERAFSEYEAKYQLSIRRPVRVQMFADHDEFMVRSVGLPGSVGHLGICFGQLVTMDSPRARRPKSVNWQSVLWHEFVHVVTLQKSRNRMPRWLSEGISIYEEKTGSPAWGQALDPDFKPIIDEEGYPGMAELQDFFMQPKTPMHLTLGYFFSGEFTRFYVERFGFETLLKSLERMGTGAPADVCLVDAAGVTLEEMNAQFRAHLEHRCAPLAHLPVVPKHDEQESAMLTAGPKAWIDLPSPFTDALRRGRTAAEAKDVAGAESAFHEALALYPEYSGQDGPLYRLAALYKENGLREKLRETLLELSVLAPSDFGVCEDLMALAREDNDWAELSRVAGLAFGVDPFDTGLLSAKVEAATHLGDTAGALAALDSLALLDRARDTEYRLKRAELLLLSQDAAAAKKEVIALLEATPHYWKAQELLLKIVDGDVLESHVPLP